MPKPEHWRKARDLFLKEAFPEAYQAMQKAGTLKEHLAQVGQEADEMWADLQHKMMADPDLPVEYQERVKALERIPEVVRELVNHDLIHAKPPM